MKSLRILISVAIIVFVVDQVTKFYILHILDLPRIRSIIVFEGFNLSMAWNRGVNFGLFASENDKAQYILITLSIVISGVLVAWGRKTTGLSQVACGLIVGGALGNALDRAIYKGVADFLNVTCCGIHNPYAFNVADIAIFMGAFILIVHSGKSDEKKPAKKSS